MSRDSQTCLARGDSNNTVLFSADCQSPFLSKILCHGCSQIWTVCLTCTRAQKRYQTADQIASHLRHYHTQYYNDNIRKRKRRVEKNHMRSDASPASEESPPPLAGLLPDARVQQQGLALNLRVQANEPQTGRISLTGEEVRFVSGGR
jgi:hypothetical protein